MFIINYPKHKKSSSFIELFALVFLIHFFSALFYSAFMTVFHRVIPNHLISIWDLNLLVGCFISAPNLIITIILERLYLKPMSILVAKYLFRTWLFGMFIIFWVGF